MHQYMKMYARMGDMMGYARIKDIDDLVQRCQENGLRSPVRRRSRYALEFHGGHQAESNFVGIFRGPDSESPIETITGDIIATLNERL